MVNFRITWTLYTGAVGNSAYQMEDWTAQLETAPTKGETGQRSWKQRLPYERLDSAVGNSTYQRGDRTAQLETAPTKHGERKCLHIYIVHHK